MLVFSERRRLAKLFDEWADENNAAKKPENVIAYLQSIGVIDPKRRERRWQVKKPDTLEFDWPETGRLEILMRGSHSAVLRYAPSKAAIEETLQKAAQGSTRRGEPQVSPNPSKRRPLNHGKPSFDNREEPSMQMSNNDDFARISAECQRHLKAGMLDWYAFDLKSMAALLGKEEKHTDKLKVLMLAFYIDLSGVSQRPFIDRALLASITTAAIR